MVKAPKSAHVVKGVPAQAAVAAGDDDERELPLGGELLHPPQPLQEMGDSQDKEIQEGVQALLNNHGGDIEGGGVDPSNMLPDENGSASSTARKEGKRLTHHYLKFALLLVTISTVPLIDILFLRGDALKLPLGLKFAAFFAFTAFVTAISLMFHTLKLMTIKPEHVISAINQLKLSIVLLATSISSLILSFISITCSLLPKAYYFLPISLVPSILVGVFHLSLVTTSFSGFIGDLLGIYHKTEKLGGQYSYAKVSIFFMLGSGLAGILALLLCRLLSNSEVHRRRRQSPSGIWWQKTVLAIANVVMLAMLVPALLLIAATILHGLLLPAVVFPVVAGAAAWAFIEFCTAAVGEEEEEDGKSELGDRKSVV